jgi:hypothetical protein
LKVTYLHPSSTEVIPFPSFPINFHFPSCLEHFSSCSSCREEDYLNSSSSFTAYLDVVGHLASFYSMEHLHYSSSSFAANLGVDQDSSSSATYPVEDRHSSAFAACSEDHHPTSSVAY